MLKSDLKDLMVVELREPILNEVMGIVIGQNIVFKNFTINLCNYDDNFIPIKENPVDRRSIDIKYIKKPTNFDFGFDYALIVAGRCDVIYSVAEPKKKYVFNLTDDEFKRVQNLFKVRGVKL